MKVLHIIGGGDTGGAKSHVISLVKQLGKHIDVKIISLRPGVFSDDARLEGIKIEVVRTGNIIRDIKRVIEIIRAEGYQIIHSHGAKANMIAVFAKYATNLPTVTTVHSDYRLDYLQSIYKKFSFGIINTIALRFVDYYIAVSKNYKKMLIDRKFHDEDIFTVYNGVDFNVHTLKYNRQELFRKYNLNISDTDIVVGILARFDPVKNVGLLVDAANLVLRKNPSVKFVLAGDGPERKLIDKKIREYGISDNIFLPGWISESHEFVNSFDINVLTSLSESFPYAILEGTIFSKATVSSNVGGISDLIDDGKTGFLFEPGDFKKLAECILRLVEDDKLRKEMGENIYQKASTYFSLESMCNTQLEIYTSILSRKCKNAEHDVIISGYYGHENSGDDAILMAMVNNLRAYKKDIKIMVLSKRPDETRKANCVDSINRFNVFKIMWYMRKARLFINGGGSLIQDITSTRSLMYYLGTIWLAKKMGMKVMVYANGIGPIKKKINRSLAQDIVNQVDVITLREESSVQELKRLSIDKPKIIVTADPALNIHAARDSEADKIFAAEEIGSSGPYVGIAVREWEECEKNFEETIARTADYIIEQYGAKPIFIPMQYPVDIPVIERIISKMKGKGYFIKNRYSVPRLLSVIKKMDMLIGMRLHSLIYAASVGVPLIGIVYEQKVEGFLQYINQASTGNVRYLDYDKMKLLVDEVWSSRQIVRGQLDRVITALKEKALDNAKIAVDLINDGK